MNEIKPFKISKQDVWNAWMKVKKNKGSHGVDMQTIEKYETNIEKNLYKLWNQMSSGSYFPLENRELKIPKSKKGFRLLGVPTVNDRIAQTVVADTLTERVDKTFHKDSYGFRPGMSAHDALETARVRCFKFEYVVDFDIKGLFDNIPHELIYKALVPLELENWELLYIRRWLEIGDKAQQGIGTPQGGVVSPVLANIFMDVCFDKWMEKNYPNISFERYADDVIVHCKSEKQTLFILDKIEKRLNKCGIELNREKTRLANTKCIKTRQIPNVSFDFLGYTFKPQKALNKKTQRYFTSFRPVIATEKRKTINSKIEKSGLLRRTSLKIEETAKGLNPKIRGWYNYYGYFNIYDMKIIYSLLDRKIAKFLKRKYKLPTLGNAYGLLKRIKNNKPDLFYHWAVNTN